MERVTVQDSVPSFFENPQWDGVSASFQQLENTLLQEGLVSDQDIKKGYMHALKTVSEVRILFERSQSRLSSHDILNITRALFLPCFLIELSKNSDVRHILLHSHFQKLLERHNTPSRRNATIFSAVLGPCLLEAFEFEIGAKLGESDIAANERMRATLYMSVVLEQYERYYEAIDLSTLFQSYAQAAVVRDLLLEAGLDQSTADLGALFLLSRTKIEQTDSFSYTAGEQFIPWETIFLVFDNIKPIATRMFDAPLLEGHPSSASHPSETYIMVTLICLVVDSLTRTNANRTIDLQTELSSTMRLPDPLNFDIPYQPITKQEHETAEQMVERENREEILLLTRLNGTLNVYAYILHEFLPISDLAVDELVNQVFWDIDTTSQELVFFYSVIAGTMFGYTPLHVVQNFDHIKEEITGAETYFINALRDAIGANWTVLGKRLKTPFSTVTKILGLRPDKVERKVLPVDQVVGALDRNQGPFERDSLVASQLWDLVTITIAPTNGPRLSLRDNFGQRLRWVDHALTLLDQDPQITIISADPKQIYRSKDDIAILQIRAAVKGIPIEWRIVGTDNIEDVTTTHTAYKLGSILFALVPSIIILDNHTTDNIEEYPKQRTFTGELTVRRKKSSTTVSVTASTLIEALALFPKGCTIDGAHVFETLLSCNPPFSLLVQGIGPGKTRTFDAQKLVARSRRWEERRYQDIKRKIDRLCIQVRDKKGITFTEEEKAAARETMIRVSQAEDKIRAALRSDVSLRARVLEHLKRIPDPFELQIALFLACDIFEFNQAGLLALLGSLKLPDLPRIKERILHSVTNQLNFPETKTTLETVMLRPEMQLPVHQLRRRMA